MPARRLVGRRVREDGRAVLDASLDTSAEDDVERGAFRRAPGSLSGVARLVGGVGLPVAGAVRRVMALFGARGRGGRLRGERSEVGPAPARRRRRPRRAVETGRQPLVERRRTVPGERVESGVAPAAPIRSSAARPPAGH
ncbi:hypothetical protein [Streptomyces sp. NPDC051704]|uniref:hypothetical protein n=1 Tax=Streptomyces sp. NPDC051704 TaxID=3365671 RepID=UPI003790F4DD